MTRWRNTWTRNFPAGNTTADSTQEKLQVWYIDGKNTETSEAIEFRLTSPMDLQGLMIPTRQLHSLYLVHPWQIPQW
jgi:lambda family phage minor tail protein L